jgi:uncharacterized membrane protein
LVKSLDDRINEQRARWKANELWASISFLTAAGFLLTFIVVWFKSTGSGEAYYFAAQGIVIIFWMLSPVLLVALVAGTVFSVKASRAKKELHQLKQFLRAQQAQ